MVACVYPHPHQKIHETRERDTFFFSGSCSEVTFEGPSRAHFWGMEHYEGIETVRK